jgi:predicted permease
MRPLHRLASFWRTLFGSTRLERELDEELRAAVDELAGRHADAGLDPERARRAAAIALGGVEQVKEEVRANRVGAGVEALLLDVRYAWRGLRKAPAFTAVVLLTLALGAGANSAIFSVVRALLLSPLPYRDADRLIFVWGDMSHRGYPRAPLSGPELQDLRQQSTTCSAFAAIWANTAALTDSGDPEQLRIGRVTADFFDVLGAEAALGRTFRAEDALDGAAPTILISWELFRRRFGADPAVVGKRILVNDRPTAVIGVMPEHFRLLLPPDAAVPDRLQAWQPFGDGLVHSPRGQLFLRVIGRMRPGTSLASARDDIAGIARRIGREHTQYGEQGRAFATVALHDDGVREVRAPLLALFGGVGLLLTIACVNVASILIARAAARRKEIALKLALGASRGRLLRQSAAEGLLLSLMGGLAGVIAAFGVKQVLTTIRPESLSRVDAATIDLTIFGFTLATSLVWGLLFSLAPLGEIFRTDAGTALAPLGRTTSTPLRYGARAALVVLQVALSVVLLVSAGLLVRGFVEVLQVDSGFRSERILTFRVAIPVQRYRPRDAFNTFTRELQSRLAVLPGVTGVGALSHIPYDDLPNWGTPYLSETATTRTGAPLADARTVLPGSLEALGVRLLEGRFFTGADQDPKNPVAIVDDKLARRMWPNGSAIGQRLLVDPFSTGVPDMRVTIVGVVRHLRLRSLVDDLTEQIFFPQRLVGRNPIAVLLRTAGDPEAIAADVRAAVAGLDPRLPIYDVRALETYVENARAARRFAMQLASAFAASALALAMIGVYGVLAYSVARRRHEFGVRRALGADVGRIVRGVLREGLGFALAGCAAGVCGAAAAAWLLQGQLYGVRAYDPATYAAALAAIAIAAAIACWIPARRAAAVSPMDALRVE